MMKAFLALAVFLVTLSAVAQEKRTSIDESYDKCLTDTMERFKVQRGQEIEHEENEKAQRREELERVQNGEELERIQILRGEALRAHTLEKMEKAQMGEELERAQKGEELERIQILRGEALEAKYSKLTGARINKTFCDENTKTCKITGYFQFKTAATNKVVVSTQDVKFETDNNGFCTAGILVGKATRFSVSGVKN